MFHVLTWWDCHEVLVEGLLVFDDLVQHQRDTNKVIINALNELSTHSLDFYFVGAIMRVDNLST